MTNHDFSFEGLRVYQATRQLVKDVYVLVNKFPAVENFALSSQVRRAVVSVSANIAEGSGRNHAKDKAHFIEMAFGSLMEVSSQFEIAEELGYITTEDRLSMDELVKEEARLLSGLQKTYKPSTDSIEFKL